MGKSIVVTMSSKPKFHLDKKSYYNEKKRLNLLWKILQPKNRVKRVRFGTSRQKPIEWN